MEQLSVKSLVAVPIIAGETIIFIVVAIASYTPTVQSN